MADSSSNPVSTPAPNNQALLSFLFWSALLLIAAFVVADLSLPNFVRNPGPSQTSGIIWRLRQIDAAKQLWALDQRQTNDVPVTAADIAPYLTNHFPQGLVTPVFGERYHLNTLCQPPTAELTHPLERHPTGTVLTPESN